MNAAQKVDVEVLDDLLRAARFYCDREGVENRSNYANDMLERGEKCIAAVAELIEAARAAKDEMYHAECSAERMDSFQTAWAALDASLARIGSAA